MEMDEEAERGDGTSPAPRSTHAAQAERDGASRKRSRSRWQEVEGHGVRNAVANSDDDGDGDGEARQHEKEQQEQEQEQRRKRRASRWEPQAEAADEHASGKRGRTEERDLRRELDAVTTMMRLENANLPVDELLSRSSTPEPIYDARGVRINTRVDRARQKLEKQRSELLSKLKQLSSAQKIADGAPVRADQDAERVYKRYYLEVDQHPEVNMIGLIIGPRGNTHKRLEQDFDVRVRLRGKGSVKDGRGRTPRRDDDDELHVVVSAEGAQAEQRVDGCIERIKELTKPLKDSENDHKQKQLRELAELNGTLLQAKSPKDRECFRCGSDAHIARDCTQPPQMQPRAGSGCFHCGHKEHIARDCPDRASGPPFAAQRARHNVANGEGGGLDAEYSNLMADITGTAREVQDLAKDKRTDLQPPQSSGEQGEGAMQGMTRNNDSMAHRDRRFDMPHHSFVPRRSTEELLDAVVPIPPWRALLGQFQVHAAPTGGLYTMGMGTAAVAVSGGYNLAGVVPVVAQPLTNAKENGHGVAAYEPSDPVWLGSGQEAIIAYPPPPPGLRTLLNRQCCPRETWIQHAQERRALPPRGLVVPVGHSLACSFLRVGKSRHRLAFDVNWFASAWNLLAFAKKLMTRVHIANARRCRGAGSCSICKYIIRRVPRCSGSARGFT
ncbi:Branchpoint-bridging protein [Porphyridium purpureum]|uniref:Branchpoint-bridging protein n=1 Tax=Porphyridium purpureum TaxID=35688 RepID=A0A5J4YL70_PORPP|nr:Branchpoint-bridging protein [Porphyridium purpureum]|eukprot:POR2747..scf210_14